MLEVKNISTGYGKKQVLYNVSFNVADNEIVLLTGGNGSGKSTVLKCIYGILPTWNNEGQIFFNGKDLTKIHTSSMVNEGIVYIPQKNNYFEDFTIVENLKISGSIYSAKEIKKRISFVYDILPELKTQCNRTPYHLSGGERQILVLGMSLIHQPKLVLFDEPLAGLDEKNTNSTTELIMRITLEQDKSFLIVEHKNTFNLVTNNIIHLELGKLVNA